MFVTYIGVDDIRDLSRNNWIQVNLGANFQMFKVFESLFDY